MKRHVHTFVSVLVHVPHTYACMHVHAVKASCHLDCGADDETMFILIFTYMHAYVLYTLCIVYKRMQPCINVLCV
jgi:hypothetical protein